jgi:hypothetical protein
MYQGDMTMIYSSAEWNGGGNGGEWKFISGTEKWKGITGGGTWSIKQRVNQIHPILFKIVG